MAADIPNFSKALEEARNVFSSFFAKAASVEDQASAMRTYLSRKYGVNTKVSLSLNQRLVNYPFSL